MADLRPFLITTQSPNRLAPIHRVCYAPDPWAAARAVLDAHPEEILYDTITESPFAGLPTFTTRLEFCC